MNLISHKKVSLVCACLFWGAQVFAAETNSVSAPAMTDAATQNVMNGYLQIQAQLHDAQLAIEDSRQQMAAESKRTADALTARIQTIEDTIATQRASEAETAQKNQQFALMMAVAFGLILVAAVLFMAYLQWRAVARLVELSARRPQEFSTGNLAPASLVSSAAVDQSSARLFGAVDQLQKRIQELEQGSRATLAEKNPSTANGSHGISEAKKENSTDRDREECVANLLAEGQSLLDANEPEKALECFDVALGLEPKHAEALVKKGGALEKLGRPDEAIACYDRAIEANSALTIAHLHKGGLFNRMARYDEALQCYEQALRTQEKKMPGAQVAT
ncbi:MAG TPA: tetratricopeptide repeat protein [Verrucomicrobiae bacterium]|jgi:tetratricopeptide (TPR) repeat protein|nr:tetratricopeptide repeat protein [Verrucomicrobiae bacterium]